MSQTAMVLAVAALCGGVWTVICVCWALGRIARALEAIAATWAVDALEADELARNVTRRYPGLQPPEPWPQRRRDGGA